MSMGDMVVLSLALVIDWLCAFVRGRERGNKEEERRKSQQEACAAAWGPRVAGPIATLPHHLQTPARVE